MSPDPIVDEIKRVREEIAARFNYDLAAIVKDVQSRQTDGKRRVVRREPRRLQESGVAQQPAQ